MRSSCIRHLLCLRMLDEATAAAAARKPHRAIPLIILHLSDCLSVYWLSGCLSVGCLACLLPGYKHQVNRGAVWYHCCGALACRPRQPA